MRGISPLGVQGQTMVEDWGLCSTSLCSLIVSYESWVRGEASAHVNMQEG